MNKTSDNMEKRIRSVKTWLDKAEQAYADDSTTKGQLQLMLAKAEMQHLDEKGSATLWQCLGHWRWVIGILLLLGVTYYLWQGFVISAPPVTPAVDRLQETESMDTIRPITSRDPMKSTNQQADSIKYNKDANAVNPAGVIDATKDYTSTAESASTAGGTVGEESLSRATSNADEKAAIAATTHTTTEETITTSVISTAQIQEAVREGGRSLRGQE